jgi:cation:H+ antiporter
MLEFIIALIIGFILLVWSADRFVLGSAATARNLGVAPLVIGMTIMGFGTSAPEMLVATIASLENNPGLAIGNAVGSNIANIAMVLGITSLIAPMIVDSNTLRREFPIMFFVMILAYALMFDGELGRLDGIVLLTGLLAVIIWMVRMGLKSKDIIDPLQTELIDEVPSELPMKTAIFWIIIGLSVLIFSSYILVWGATGIARAFGVSDLIIGLTIVAIGTSLPELAASVMGALKGEHEIALGNIIGSNMFNILGVLGVAGLIQPSHFVPDVLLRDFPVMIGLTIALFIMAYGFRGPGRINRIEGAILFSTFAAYLAYLYFTAI